jgi:hypothetical protein
LLADQQNKCSGSYQHRNQNTDNERGNPMPTLNGFERSQPNPQAAKKAPGVPGLRVA